MRTVVAVAIISSSVVVLTPSPSTLVPVSLLCVFDNSSKWVCLEMHVCGNFLRIGERL